MKYMPGKNNNQIKKNAAHPEGIKAAGQQESLINWYWHSYCRLELVARENSLVF
jgi:hypothetical protein